MAIANLAMATGNLGRKGVGVNPLRGQNNVQGSCDMGSFPHEYPGYRHVSNDETRELFEKAWGVDLDPEPGLRIPNMFDAAVEGRFKGLYVQGEDILQSDPDIRHVSAGLGALDCLIVQDLFLNETANYAHVFLPGASFLEKDGVFINAERRVQRVRRVMSPKAGYADWEATQLLANALGCDWSYTHPREIWEEMAALTPPFAGITYKKLDDVGSVQWPCNDAAPDGMPIMHIDGFARGKGKFVITEYVPTDERTGPRFPLLLTTGRILSQYNVGAQTRRTENSQWHPEDVLEIHPHDAELARRSRRRLGARAKPRRRDHAARQDHRPCRAGRRLHDLPPSALPDQCRHHRQFGLGDELPRIQGDRRAGLALQRPDRMAGALSRHGGEQPPDRSAGDAGGVRASSMIEMLEGCHGRRL